MNVKVSFLVCFFSKQNLFQGHGGGSKKKKNNVGRRPPGIFP